MRDRELRESERNLAKTSFSLSADVHTVRCVQSLSKVANLANIVPSAELTLSALRAGRPPPLVKDDRHVSTAAIAQRAPAEGEFGDQVEKQENEIK